MTLYTKRGTSYVPTTLSEQGAWGRGDLMAIAAFRYCLGRMTYIVGDCEQWIFANWGHFPENVKKLIQRLVLPALCSGLVVALDFFLNLTLD